MMLATKILVKKLRNTFCFCFKMTEKKLRFCASLEICVSAEPLSQRCCFSAADALTK
jgi:hypothetical protein